jgi:hypothetical protein
MKFNKDVLKQSQVYRNWVTGDVALIHNIYDDNVSPTYVVIHSQNSGYWSVTRFFAIDEIIHVSADHVDIPCKEVFKILAKLK